MITDNQFDEMVDLQDRLNRTIDKKWRDADNDWGLAIMAECMELIDHVGWKWWKDRPTVSMAQVHLEVVDVWHFILSWTMATGSENLLRMRLASEPNAWLQDRLMLPHEVIASAKGLSVVAATPYDSLARLYTSFFMLMRSVRLSFDELYRLYVGKSVLNLFRQQMGYRRGSYQKVWGGLEDNERLEKLLDENPDASPQQLLWLLGRAYPRSSAET